MTMVGKMGGRPPLPTLQQLRVDTAAEQITKQGGEERPDRRISSLSTLKRLWKIEQNKRERLFLEAASPREV